jgi:hypothetical protein
LSSDISYVNWQDVRRPNCNRTSFGNHTHFFGAGWSENRKATILSQNTGLVIRQRRIVQHDLILVRPTDMNQFFIDLEDLAPIRAGRHDDAAGVSGCFHKSISKTYADEPR